MIDRPFAAAAGALALVALVAACSSSSVPPPTGTSQPHSTATPTVSPTGSGVPTSTPTGSSSPTPTPFPVVTITPTPMYTGSPTPSPTPSPTTTATTIGAPGSTLGFPSVGPGSASLVVPVGMASPGSAAGVSAQFGRPGDGLLFVGGRTLETFGLTLYGVTAFHEPAVTVTIPSGFKPPQGFALATTYAGASGPNDYAVVPSTGATTLSYPSDSTCLTITPGTTIYFSVVALASPPAYPVPTPGPSTCPL